MTELPGSPTRSEGATIFLVASESSGDRLGAALMRALRTRSGAQIRFLGVGGDQMQAAGLTSMFSLDEFATIGLTSLLRGLPLIFRRIREVSAAVIAAKPDALVIIDSPDFTH